MEEEEPFYLCLGCNTRSSLYTVSNNVYYFENPVFDPDYVPSTITNGEASNSNIRLKDFLASIPCFSDFSDEQLCSLEQKAQIKEFNSGDVVFRQGDPGDAFYVINEGSVNVLINDNLLLVKKGDYGKIVNKLTSGCYFGERALMTAEARAATIQVIQDHTVCLVFSRKVYEELISGSNALIGDDSYDNVDWSKDHETRSLFKHIESVLEIDNKSTSPRIRRILYELSTAFTPELSVDEIISRMVLTVKAGLRADRVGLFVLSEDKKSMVLKVSERSKGIRLPVRGLAGAVLQLNQPLNIPDAYQDSRFDATMDRRTGYRTRQVLGVPVRHPVSGDPVGLLQVNNRTDGSLEPYSAEQQRILELAAEQLSELLHGRAEVFIHSGVTSKSLGNNVDGTSIANTFNIISGFQIEITTLSLTESLLEPFVREGCTVVEVCASLFLSLSNLCDPQSLAVDLTRSSSGNGLQSLATTTIQLKEKLSFNIPVRDLPRASRLHLQIFGRKKKGGARVPLGWAALAIFDFKGCMESSFDLKMFPGENDVPINTTLSNSNLVGASSLIGVLACDQVSMGGNGNTPRVRIVHSMPPSANSFEKTSESDGFSDTYLTELERIRNISFNPLSMTMLRPSDKEFLWEIRHRIVTRADLLPAFVMSVPWQSADHVQELYDLLEMWTPPTAVQALQLLDRRFMDPKVRAFAVHCLEELGDEELSLYMLQLCQQLKFENYIDSALARFLVRRALANKRLIGHIFFWFLQSEVYNKDVKRRFSILLQIYIRNCGDHRVELGHQMFVMKRLERVAERVVQGNSKEERKEILRKQLTETVLPNEFQLPLNPHIKVKGIEVDRCRVMESKKKPLWLTLKNADELEDDIVLMLKVGDDLRQDALIIQLLRVMDEIWRREGLDMQMMLYDCISTGYERGLLQIVLNATTLANILMDATDKDNKRKSGSLGRKFSSAMKAISDFDVLKDWIWEQVCEDIKGDESRRKTEMEKRTQNFMISTAAYCVASYVLGLGDRHNDNLMITRSAHFFHIDFGHILGNFKSKYGVKRERAPFVFTPAMKAVMREDQYEAFVDLCCDIYNILRDNASLLVSLFSLAIPCNLPELQKEQDVMWIYEKLLVGASDEEASAHFREQLEISLNTRGTRLNDAAHMLAHA